MYQCQKVLHQWVKRIKRPIEDVEETLTTFIKKFVLPVDSVNLKGLEDTAGKTKNQPLEKD